MELRPEQNPTTESEQSPTIEERILKVKADIQIEIIAETLKINPEDVAKIISWINTNGEMIDEYLHKHLELLELHRENREKVLEIIRELLATKRK